MGALLSSCAPGSTDVRAPVVLLVGLDGAGTTTMLYRVACGQRMETLPTLGCNKEVVTVSDMRMWLYDVGGSERVRALWRKYSKEANGVAFVVDVSDERRLAVAADELRRLFFGDQRGGSLIVPDIPLLVFCNKMDLEGGLHVDQVEAGLELQELPVRRYKVLPAVATEGRNLNEGFQWMAAQLREYGH
jgi:signal recognition particle receptor subunit beta